MARKSREQVGPHHQQQHVWREYLELLRHILEGLLLEALLELLVLLRTPAADRIGLEDRRVDTPALLAVLTRPRRGVVEALAEEHRLHDRRLRLRREGPSEKHPPELRSCCAHPVQPVRDLWLRRL